MPGAALPDWPAMMDRDLAATYCGMSADSFDVCCALYRCYPRQLPVRLTRWRRADLDAMLDRLPARGQPDAPSPTPPVDDAANALRLVAGQMKR